MADDFKILKLLQPNPQGPLTEGLVGAVTISQGSADAGKVPLLGSDGKLDISVGGGGGSSLATVATSGSYNDLNNKPTLGTAAAQNITAFDAAGSAATVQTNLTSEVTRATTAEGLLVAKTTTVNGHALSANVTVSASDITTGTLPVAQLPTIPYANLSGTPTIPSVPITTIQNNGVVVTPASGVINLVPGSNIALTTSGDAVTIATSGLGSAAFQPSSAFDAAGAASTETTRAEAAEALLAPKASPTFTGTVSGITAVMVSALPNTTTLATTFASVAHTCLNSYNSSTGVFTAAQLATTDLSDIGTFTLPIAQVSGTLPHAQLPTLLSGDIPSNAANTTGTSANVTATTNSTLTTLSVLSLPYGQVTGTPTVPVVATTTPVMDGTATIGSVGKWADAGHIHPSDTSRAPLASPTFTGTVTAPTINATTAHQINGVALAAITTVGAGLSLASGTITTVGQQPVEKSCFATGIFTASQVLYYNKASIAYTIASGTTNQYFTLMTAATGSCTFTLLKNGTSFGTIAVAASGTTGTFTISSPVSFAVGDVLTMTAPSSADTTAAGAALSLYGVR